MENHVLQYAPDYSINIVIEGLNANSYISFSESGIIKKYEAKGVFVGKLSQEANTNYGMIQLAEDGRVITSSSNILKNQLPFAYFANSTSDLSFMDSIDRKMINGITKMVWGVYPFNTGGIYVEPVDFSLTSQEEGVIDLNLLCGFSYNDLQYSYRKDAEDWNEWTSFDTSVNISGLVSGNYGFKVKSEGTTLTEIPEHSISVYVENII
jgi:hypothetical protein